MEKIVKVWWTKEKYLCTYSEATKSHYAVNKIKTLCGIKIGKGSCFHENKGKIDCKRCLKQLEARYSFLVSKGEKKTEEDCNELTIIQKRRLKENEYIPYELSERADFQ